MAKKRDGTVISTGHIWLGKLAPSSVDVEELILGALLVESHTYPSMQMTLKPEMFYKDAHQHVYKAIQTLSDKGEAVDIVTVTHELKRMKVLDEVGGPYFLTQLTSRIASAAHINEHVAIVKQQWIKREAIRMAMGIINEAYDDSSDCFEMLIKGQELIDNVSQSLDGKRIRNLKELAWEVKQEVITRASTKELPGLPTGFKDLDEALMGLMKTDLIVLAARPGMGKSAMAMQIAKNVARHILKVKEKKGAVAVFSLEMKDKQLVMRMLSEETEINSRAIMFGRLEYQEQKKIELVDLNIPNLVIDDTANINIQQLRSKVIRLRAIHGSVELIVLDYIQLMSGMSDGENREGQISSITRGLKQIAKDFDVPIIALSQLSREVEKRANKRPVLSDLRESGAIEQDADAVLFIFRPDYYDLSDNPKGEDLRGLAKVIIAKHRHSELKDVKMRFTAKYVRFEDYEHIVKPVEEEVF